MSQWTNDTAEWYAEKYGEYPTNRLALDSIKFAQNSVVVDIGCGTGAALRHIASLAPRAELIGIDPVDRMIEIAQERASKHPEGARLQFRQGAAELLPVEDETVDLVLAFDSIDHWTNRRKGLQEVQRILKHTGKLVIVKDGGVPKSQNDLTRELKQAQFAVESQQLIEAENITFTVWECNKC